MGIFYDPGPAENSQFPAKNIFALYFWGITCTYRAVRKSVRNYLETHKSAKNKRKSTTAKIEQKWGFFMTPDLPKTPDFRQKIFLPYIFGE